MNLPKAQPLNVVGIVVHCTPGKIDSVRAALASMDGVNVHADGGDGRLVATAIDTDDVMAIDQLAVMNRMPGIVSTMLAYHQIDHPETVPVAAPCCGSAASPHACTPKTGA